MGLILLLSSQAWAFNTLRDNCTGFNALAWPPGDITWHMGHGGTTDVPPQPLEQAIQASFAAWENRPDSSIRFRYDGEVQEHPGVQDFRSGITPAQNRYGPWSQNRNVVVFQNENWPQALHGARGITFALFHKCDGTLLQSDIIMNDTYTDWFTGPMPAGCEHCFDVQNMVTHEVGHFIGIAHTDVPGATMNICDQPGASVADCECNRAGMDCGRSLEADDLAALQTLYPLLPDLPLPNRTVGSLCNSNAECESGICVWNDDRESQYCTAACTEDGECPEGWVCVSPPANENPDGLNKCWFGTGLVGDLCTGGCRSGMCSQERCTDDCDPNFDQCPAGYECVASSQENAFCELRQNSQVASTLPEPNAAPSGCTGVSPNLADWFLFLTLSFTLRTRRHKMRLALGHGASDNY